MKITKFRIHNFKSIIDSGDCYPAQMVTILAGKNEAGKSSILEALEDFSYGRKIREKAIPIFDSSRKPKIQVWFEIFKENLESICRDTNTELGLLPPSVQICITKEFPASYEISGEFVDKYYSHPLVDYISPIREAYTIISSPTIKAISTQVVAIPALSLTDLSAALSTFVSYQAQIIPHLARFAEPDQNNLKDGLAVIIERIRTAIDNSPSPKAKFKTSLLRAIPNFILFNSFDDVFPSQILLDDLDENEWIDDLKHISDIDVDVITGSNDRAKVTHKKLLNTKLNQDFKQFWSQDFSQLVIEWDNQKLTFWIEEDGYYYEPEIRSQGRRWHLAFYIKVSARAKEGMQNNVILIDEPGLYLHANAQRDILKNLETAGQNTQIIFSTHSPYLIESDKLDRIRLVQKNEDAGTTIENKVHSVSDKETLTPILTSIGLELTSGIVANNHKNNVIVEGASDYFYLNAFREIFSWGEINFVSGGCSGNMTKVGTILQGWGGNVFYLYDNDQAYKDARKNIKKEWLTINSELVAKLPIDGSIEDLFSIGDFKKYVLIDAEANILGKNSEFMKGKDKVLKAKLFLEKARKDKESIKLDQLSTENIEKLRNVIQELMTKI